MIYLPEKCLRDSKDCEPIAQLQADENDAGGIVFYCVGLNDGTKRKEEQDILTQCFKNEEFDRYGHCDKRDLIDEMSITAQALSILENMEANKPEEAEDKL